MGKCEICELEKPLTLNDVIPVGLIDRLIPVSEGKLRWIAAKGVASFDGLHYKVRDECKDCQLKFQRVFDDRVIQFKTYLDQLQKNKPRIVVEEPFFTLYALRVFWSASRANAPEKTPEEIKDAIRFYINNNDQTTDFLKRDRIVVTFCQEPPKLVLNKTSIRVRQVDISKGGTFFQGHYVIWEGYIRLLRLKVHIYALDREMVKDPAAMTQFQEFINLKREIVSRWNIPGPQTYRFKNFCSYWNDPENVEQYVLAIHNETKRRKTKRS